MSSFCECTLIVWGSKSNVAAFTKAATGYDRQYNDATMRSLIRRYQKLLPKPKLQQFCFHSLVPVPDEVLQAGFDSAGYDWEVSNWGCKWGALDIKVQHCPMSKGAKVIYKFKTANSAPLALLDVVAQNHPALFFKLKCDGTSLTWKKGLRYG